MRGVLLQLGRVVSVIALASAQTAGADTTTYVYDALGRLSTTTISGGPANGSQTATNYDPADNRSSHSVAVVAGNPPTFSISSASASEGSPVVFTVTKSGTASGTLSVDYATANGSATSPADYTTKSGTLSFLIADTTKTVSVTTVDDALVEGGETFTLNLLNPSPGGTVTDPTGTGTISDNDSVPPSFAIANAAAVVEGGTLAFKITKSGSASAPFSVAYASANGTATAGSDYTAVAGTLTFQASETSKVVNVVTTDDSAAESDETALVNLSAPSGGATISRAQATGTIHDDAPTNHSPVANPDATSLRQCETTSLNVVGNDTDPDGDSLILQATSTGNGLSISVVSTTTVSIESTGLPGTKTFTYTISDQHGGTAVGTVTVTVTVGGACP